MFGPWATTLPMTKTAPAAPSPRPNCPSFMLPEPSNAAPTARVIPASIIPATTGWPRRSMSASESADNAAKTPDTKRIATGNPRPTSDGVANIGHNAMPTAVIPASSDRANTASVPRDSAAAPPNNVAATNANNNRSVNPAGGHSGLPTIMMCMPAIAAPSAMAAQNPRHGIKRGNHIAGKAIRAATNTGNHKSVTTFSGIDHIRAIFRLPATR